MSKKDVFVILPYLKTSSPVHLRGILFRSNDDLKGLSPEQESHLKTLFSMFYLRNDLHIVHMIYAHLELDEDREQNTNVFQRLYEAQTLINYFYSTPHPSMGEPFLHKEHANMYIFTLHSVYSGFIWPNDPNVDYGVENISQEQLPFDTEIDGYEGILNGVSYFWVVPGNRIYPPVPHLTLNISQDLIYDLQRYTQQSSNWAMVRILMGREHENEELNERIFTALEWHNRSTSEDVSEEVALLNLAVAFESLLNLEQGEKLTDRFRETVMTLLGSVPRLDSWLEQFYNARSSIVHKGRTEHLMFYAMDRDRNRLVKIYKGKDSSQTPALPYHSLTMGGRRIFRLCLIAIISGALLAEENGLSSLFVNNQERLIKICEQLRQTSQTPEKRLRSIEKDVGDLHQNSWVAGKLVKSETLVAAGQLVLQTYLDIEPKLSEEVEAKIQEVLQQLQQKDISADEKLHFFQRLNLRQGQNTNATNPSPFREEKILTIVSSLLNYVDSSEFHHRKWYHKRETK